MLREPPSAAGWGEPSATPVRTREDILPVLLEIRLLDRRTHVFAGADVGYLPVATAILEMIHLDLDIPRLILKGCFPVGRSVPSPVLTAWHASGLEDTFAKSGIPIFTGPISCFGSFLEAVLVLRGLGEDDGQIERDLAKCTTFTFEGLVERWRSRLDDARRAIEEEDVVNPA